MASSPWRIRLRVRTSQRVPESGTREQTQRIKTATKRGMDCTRVRTRAGLPGHVVSINRLCLSGETPALRESPSKSVHRETRCTLFNRLSAGAELALEDLSRRVARQGFEEHEVARDLGPRELRF